MENNNRGTKLLGRRRALQLVGVGLGVGLGASSLLACKDKGGETTGTGTQGAGTGTAASGGGNDCNATIDEASKGMRKTLQYKKVAENAEKKCSGCAQYTAGKYGDCGGCKLFTGPVQPNGGCLSFAPVGADGGAKAG